MISHTTLLSGQRLSVGVVSRLTRHTYWQGTVLLALLASSACRGKGAETVSTLSDRPEVAANVRVIDPARLLAGLEEAIFAHQDGLPCAVERDLNDDGSIERRSVVVLDDDGRIAAVEHDYPLGDSGPASTVYEYDDRGRLITLNEGTPDVGSTRLEYDAEGRLIARIDSSAETTVRTSYVYAVDGALVERRVDVGDDGAEIAVEPVALDADGRVTRLVTDSGTVAYSYRRDGRVRRRVVEGTPAEVEFRYDPLDRLAEQVTVRSNLVGDRMRVWYTYSCD